MSCPPHVVAKHMVFATIEAHILFVSKGRASNYYLRLIGQRLPALSNATKFIFRIRWVASELNAGETASRSPRSGARYVAPEADTLKWEAVSALDANPYSSQPRGRQRDGIPRVGSPAPASPQRPTEAGEERTLHPLRQSVNRVNRNPKTICCAAHRRSHVQTWLRRGLLLAAGFSRATQSAPRRKLAIGRCW